MTRNYWADKVLPEFGREGHTGKERNAEKYVNAPHFFKNGQSDFGTTAAARRVELVAGTAVLRHKE